MDCCTRLKQGLRRYEDLIEPKEQSTVQAKAARRALTAIRSNFLALGAVTPNKFAGTGFAAAAAASMFEGAPVQRA